MKTEFTLTSFAKRGNRSNRQSKTKTSTRVLLAGRDSYSMVESPIPVPSLGDGAAFGLPPKAWPLPAPQSPNTHGSLTNERQKLPLVKGARRKKSTFPTSSPQAAAKDHPRRAALGEEAPNQLRFTLYLSKPCHAAAETPRLRTSMPASCSSREQSIQATEAHFWARKRLSVLFADTRAQENKFWSESSSPTN